MGFRKSVPQGELRAAMTTQQLEQHQTTYQASRGGHFPPAQTAQAARVKGKKSA